MEFSFGDKPLVVFEIANNHSGQMTKALKMIEGLSEVSSGFPKFAFGVKFQYRHLDTFIHQSMHLSKTKFVRRFLETRLDESDFKRLGEKSRKAGLLHIATPFDEPSVDLCVKNEVDLLKIASVSATDWPLLNKIGNSWNGQVIASTASKTFEEIERLSTFLDHRGLEHALMHCVALYPTPDSLLDLSRINRLIERFPSKTIGYSTHENPDNLLAGPLALAAGARIFEKHVDFGGQPGNGYSADLDQIQTWLSQLRASLSMVELEIARGQLDSMQREHLSMLQRFSWTKDKVVAGQILHAKDVQFSLSSDDDSLGIPAERFSWNSEIVVGVNISEGRMIPLEGVTIQQINSAEYYYPIVRSLLRNAGYRPNSEVLFEFSHHYGWKQFDTYGCTMVTVINDIYCKKWIVSLAGQTNPEHFHTVKQETFVCVTGKLEVSLNGEKITLGPGESITIEPGDKHSFRGLTDTVFEEISSTHNSADSHYSDVTIAENNNRKTLMRRVI